MNKSNEVSTNEKSISKRCRRVFSQGEPLKAGYEFSEYEEVILSLQKENPENPIRCLTEWVWLDLRCNAELINLYKQENIQPVILTAERIIFDSEDPNAIGYRLPRVSPLIAYKSPSSFEQLLGI